MIRSLRAPGAALVAAAWCSAAAAAWAQAGNPGHRTPPPYRGGVEQPLEFRGPADEAAPDVPEVALGWFGPGDPHHPVYGTLWRGAVLAVEQENAAGGHRGAPPAGSAQARPFRLLPVWSESPWTAGIGALLRLVYEARPWAVIGGVDGATTHLALQVALKSHFPLVTPASSDGSTERAHVPWLFSIAPSDQALAAALLPALSAAAGGGTFAVAASADHDGHAALDAFGREMVRRGLSPGAQVEFEPGEPAPAAARLPRARLRAVLVLGPGQAAGAFVKALRAGGYGGPIIGSAAASDRAFGVAAGGAAEGVIAASRSAGGEGWDAFADAYERRWHEPPDGLAASAYDAVRIVAAATRRAGLSRTRIRDALAALPTWDGASGPVRFSHLGRNEPQVRLGAWHDGRFVLDDTPRPRPR